MAYLLLRNSDKDKYEGLLRGLMTQFSMDNDQYPKTITSAIDILSNYKWDSSKAKWDKNKQKGTPKGDDDTASTASLASTEASFAQKGKKQCFCCGNEGHFSPDCPDKDKPKSQWAVKKAMNNLQTAQEAEAKDDDVSQVSDAHSMTSSMRSSRRAGFSGVQLNQLGQDDLTLRMKNDIILDNGSTLSIFSNPEMVEGVHKSKCNLKMATNGGTRVSSQEADVLGFGTVWYGLQIWWTSTELHTTQTRKTRSSCTSQTRL